MISLKCPMRAGDHCSKSCALALVSQNGRYWKCSLASMESDVSDGMVTQVSSDMRGMDFWAIKYMLHIRGHDGCQNKVRTFVSYAASEYAALTELKSHVFRIFGLDAYVMLEDARSFDDFKSASDFAETERGVKNGRDNS